MYELSIEGEVVHFEFAEGKFICEGYDLEDELLGAVLTGEYPKRLIFQLGMQSLLIEWGHKKLEEVYKHALASGLLSITLTSHPNYRHYRPIYLHNQGSIDFYDFMNILGPLNEADYQTNSAYLLHNPKLIDILGYSSFPPLILEIARNIHTDAKTLRRISRLYINKNIYIIEALLFTNSHTPSDILDECAKKSEYRLGALMHDNASLELHRKYVSHQDRNVKMALAAYSKYREILILLSRDKDIDVRHQLVRNKSLPFHARVVLSRDEDKALALEARGKYGFLCDIANFLK